MKIVDKESQFQNEIIIPDDGNFFVIVGGNNSGKSTFLRSINKTFGTNSYMVNVNRTVLEGEGSLDKNYEKNYNGYLDQFNTKNDDNYKKQVKTLQDFFHLDDEQRKPILEWYNTYFPNQIYEERENPKNSASPYLLKVNGHSITRQGSGMRSTLEIFIKLFDPKIKVLCIDEPELGLEPLLQRKLFQAIKDQASPDKKIFISTHSHHFLDYASTKNNYVCRRNSEDKISVEKSEDLQPIIFRLLGNTLSSLLLPENVIVLEGISDVEFLRRCLVILNKNDYVLHGAGSDSKITPATEAITQFLKFNNNTLNNSVYKDRIYVIADKAKDQYIRQWKTILPDAHRQLKELSRNGIEHYYPERILQEIFSATDSKEAIINGYLKSNPNEYKEIRLTKIELAKKVSELLTTEDLEDTNNELFAFLKTLG